MGKSSKVQVGDTIWRVLCINNGEKDIIRYNVMDGMDDSRVSRLCPDVKN